MKDLMQMEPPFEVSRYSNGGCRYYTRQQAPTQWIAVGVTAARTADGKQLLVGTGKTEDDAVQDLHRRCHP